jgi:hypothetical protein
VEPPDGNQGKEGRFANRPYTRSSGAEPFDPCRVGRMGSDAIRGWRAQKACPCPRLLKVNPFGVRTASGIEANRMSRATAFEAPPLIHLSSHPLCGGCLTLMKTRLFQLAGESAGDRDG